MTTIVCLFSYCLCCAVCHSFDMAFFWLDLNKIMKIIIILILPLNSITTYDHYDKKTVSWKFSFYICITYMLLNIIIINANVSSLLSIRKFYMELPQGRTDIVANLDRFILLTELHFVLHIAVGRLIETKSEVSELYKLLW